MVCHVEGNAFWRLNGTIYSELNAAFFESRGITSFDFFIGNFELNKTLTIVGSALNNNTVIHCISSQANGITNTSDSATVTVLGKCHSGSKCILPLYILDHCLSHTMTLYVGKTCSYKYRGAPYGLCMGSLSTNYQLLLVTY